VGHCNNFINYKKATVLNSSLLTSEVQYDTGKLFVHFLILISVLVVEKFKEQKPPRAEENYVKKNCRGLLDEFLAIFPDQPD
jgi:hypothetical protein